MIKLLELRRGYDIADARTNPYGPRGTDRIATERAIDEWTHAAHAVSFWYDDKPIVTRTVLPALGIVTLTVCGFHEPVTDRVDTHSLTH